MRWQLEFALSVPLLIALVFEPVSALNFYTNYVLKQLNQIFGLFKPFFKRPNAPPR